MTAFLRALCAISFGALIASAAPAAAATTTTLATMSGDWNDNPYWRTWSMEISFSPDGLVQRPLATGIEYYWDSTMAGSPLLYAKGEFNGVSCSTLWDVDCTAPTNVTDTFSLSASELSYLSIWQDGIHYGISYGGPTSAFSSAVYVDTPPYLPPDQPFHVEQYGEYGFAQVNGKNYGGIHTHVMDLQVSAVPEPATWAMMIVGLGLAGSLLRRRVRVAAA